LDRLPSEVQRRIFARLDYGSAIALSGTSARLREDVLANGDAWPLHERFRFVWARAVVRGDLRACYACFRLRRPNEFSERQLQAAAPRAGRPRLRLRVPARRSPPGAVDGPVALRAVVASSVRPSPAHGYDGRRIPAIAGGLW